MPMNPIVPRLRVINGSKQPAKVTLAVPPGAVLDVDGEVAGQLVGANVGLREGTEDEAAVVRAAVNPPEPVEDTEPEPVDDVEEQPVKRGRGKATA